MKLKKEEIEHIAELARIKLTDAEKKKFSRQLTDILDWVDQLEEVDTKEIGVGVESDLTNVLREDIIEPFVNTGSLSDAFPQAQDGHLKVKGIK